MKLRRTKDKHGNPGKAMRRLEVRIRDWERLPIDERRAYRKPGSMKP